MIDGYVNKLMDNLPVKPKHMRIDIVLDGGAFNGSYLIGALYFLKEMERRKHVTIERISGASIGSLIGFLYCIDRLDIACETYNIFRTNLSESYNFKCINELKKYIGSDALSNDVCKLVNGKLFIVYNNIKRGTKPVKCVYKDADEIINTITKSCYLPFITDGNMLHNNKYIDGINPHIFKEQSGKKILYLNLLGYDKIQGLFNVKNEKTNFHRILTGMLDIHCFYIKESTTSMCSYVNDWTLTQKCNHLIRRISEKLIVNFIVIILFVRRNIPIDVESNLLYKVISRLSFEMFKIILEFNL